MGLNEHIGQRLGRARTDAGMTVEELAEAARLPPAALVAYEAGVKRIPPACLTRLALVLKISLDRFFPDPVPIPMESTTSNRNHLPGAETVPGHSKR
jgi:transcriptional regulator with XRE-family HTH domain